ncbi:MAG: hypothetical protein ABIU29_00945 [Chthoniobacterales bacterium]
MLTTLMSEEISLQERLQILRLTDGARRWYSVDDKLVCLICERIISGREILISGRPDQYELACPTKDCPGNASHWLLFAPMADHRAKAPGPDGKGEMDFLSDFGQPQVGRL